ncbi:unnamed protein product [Diamesa tonsa]
MSTIEERTAYLDNPFFKKPIYGDFTAFYITITLCTIFAIFLCALNLICGCCSKHKHYWSDRYTGNRWIVSLWTAGPQQPPLDLSELKDVKIDFPINYPVKYTSVSHQSQRHQQEEFVELHKRESEI